MLYLASDHAGYALKAKLKEYLTKQGIEHTDVGCDDEERCDYPDYAHALAKKITASADTKGIAICGSGHGIGMALNRHAGIRAARCLSLKDAELARQHNDANILVLAGRQTDPELAQQILDIFLVTKFEGNRHAERVKKIEPPK